MDSLSAYKFGGVALYMLALLAIGFVASRRMKDVRDYFAGGKQLGFWSVAFSARATGESAWLLLGLTGMGAAVGAKAFWVVVGEVLGVAGAWLLMSRRFKRLTDVYDAITVPDYLEGRFGVSREGGGGHGLRLIAAGALVVFVTIYVSAQIDATGTAFESFLGIDYYAGALIGFAVVMVYITSGGFVAVVWSDVFQGALMFFGLVILPIVGIYAAGGWGEIATSLEAIDPTLLSFAGAGGYAPLNIIGIAGLALIGVGFLGSPQIFVRFLSLKNEDEIPKGTWVAIVWTILADSGAVLVGMIGRAVLTEPGQELTAVLGNNGQNVLPILVEHTFPALIVGLYIAIVLSAIMSTVDSLLVVAASAAVRDVYQKVLHPDLPDDALVPMSRKATVVLALCALGVALTVAITTPDRTVYWFVVFGWSGIAATFCPTIILSLFWRGFTARGAMTAMIVGFLCVPFFKFAAPSIPGVGPYLEAFTELPPAFIVSMLAGVLASRLDPNGPPDHAAVDLDAAGR